MKTNKNSHIFETIIIAVAVTIAVIYINYYKNNDINNHQEMSENEDVSIFRDSYPYIKTKNAEEIMLDKRNNLKKALSNDDYIITATHGEILTDEIYWVAEEYFDILTPNKIVTGDIIEITNKLVNISDSENEDMKDVRASSTKLAELATDVGRNGYWVNSDKTHIVRNFESFFYGRAALKISDVDTYESLSPLLFKDKNNMYYKHSRIENVDPVTFKILDTNIHGSIKKFSDKNGVYYTVNGGFIKSKDDNYKATSRHFSGNLFTYFNFFDEKFYHKDMLISDNVTQDDILFIDYQDDDSVYLKVKDEMFCIANNSQDDKVSNHFLVSLGNVLNEGWELFDSETLSLNNKIYVGCSEVFNIDHDSFELFLDNSDRKIFKDVNGIYSTVPYSGVVSDYYKSKASEDDDVSYAFNSLVKIDNFEPKVIEEKAVVKPIDPLISDPTIQERIVKEFLSNTNLKYFLFDDNKLQSSDSIGMRVNFESGFQEVELPDSLEYLTKGYFKDNKNVYLVTPDDKYEVTFPVKDINTVKVLGNYVIYDDNHYFPNRGSLGLAPSNLDYLPNFKTLNRLGKTIYYKDDISVYFEIEDTFVKIDEADYDTFSVEIDGLDEEHLLAVDKNNLYIWGDAISGLNLDTLFYNPPFLGDDKTVYIGVGGCHFLQYRPLEEMNLLKYKSC